MKRVFLTVTMIIFFVSGCATKYKVNPYKIPQEQFHAQIKKVAIFPLNFNHNFGEIDYNDIRKNIDTLIAKELERAELKIIPSDQIEKLVKEIKNQEEGIFALPPI